MYGPVPVYNLNGNGNCGNGSAWEAIAAMNSGGGGFGGMNGAWAMMMPLWLLAFLGWGGGGWGGFGGGWGGNGGGGRGYFGGVASDLAVQNATDTAEIKAGLNFASQEINGANNRLADLNTNLCNQFATTNANITNAAYQNQLGQRELQAQISNCCCETQQNICNLNNNISQQFAQLNYNNAMQNCAIEKAIASQGDRIVTLLQTQETDRLRGLLAKTEQENFMLKNCVGAAYAGFYNNGNGNGC